MLPEPEGVISDHRPTPWPGPRAARAPRPAAPGAHAHPRHPWAADAPPVPRSAVRHARGNFMLPDSPSRTKRVDLARDVNDAVTGNCRTPWRGRGVCTKAGLWLRPGRTVRRCQGAPALRPTCRLQAAPPRTPRSARGHRGAGSRVRTATRRPVEVQPLGGQRGRGPRVPERQRSGGSCRHAGRRSKPPSGRNDAHAPRFRRCGPLYFFFGWRCD